MTDPATEPRAMAASPAPAHALLQRLAEQPDAGWVGAATLDAFMAGGGRRVIVLAGDPVRFPEGLDVAVVLPELRRCASQRFAIGVVPPHDEDAVARRFGCQRWPSLVFVHDARYVATVSGMHDWGEYLQRVEQALAAPPARVPGVGIPVVGAGAGAGAASCGH